MQHNQSDNAADESTGLMSHSHSHYSHSHNHNHSRGAIRNAFQTEDQRLSRILHDQKAAARGTEGVEEAHQQGGLLKNLVFGGLDGILTSFAVVAGAAGGKLPWQVVLVLGFSNIVADALSMGTGEYMSSKAHQEFTISEKKREEWEFENHPEGEIREMVDIYMEKGMTETDAQSVVRTMAKYHDLFIDVMMQEELGLHPPDETEADLFKEAATMFASFILFGSMPLLGYCIFPPLFPSLTMDELFAVAAVVTAVALFILGAVKSKFSPKSWVVSGIETLVVGSVCAVVAFVLGDLVSGLVGEGWQI